MNEFTPVNNVTAQNDTQAFYDTRSLNNLYVEREGTAIKVYVKTNVSPLTARRLDLDANGKNALIDVYLHTRTPNDYAPYVITMVENSKGELVERLDKNSAPIPFVYADNCIELYTAQDVAIFERINAQLIRDGKLVEFVSDAQLEYIDGKLSYKPETTDSDEFVFAKVS